MGLLQDYRVNISNIESINVSVEAPGNNGYLYRVETIDIEGINPEISGRISNDLANKGNVEYESEIEAFLVKELGLSSADLINFV
ncbi:MAG: hypothetical protein RRZ84_08630 [Romboutsia sp.]